MSIRPFVALAICLSSAPAFAAADLVPSLTAGQSPAPAYAVVRYTVNVQNTGNRTASNVVATVALPATGTSPQVYVYGTLGATSIGCTRTGTTLRCPVSNIGHHSSRIIFFDLALPVSTRTFVLTATVSTTSAENSLANNTASLQAQQTYQATPVNTSPGQGVTMNNQHCTGQGLTGWFECTLFPSSISSFQTTLHHGGTLTVPAAAGYFGTWTLTNGPTGNHLTFQIEDSSGVVATFNGWGADLACFEGLTTFPTGTYVAPYRVCP